MSVSWHPATERSATSFPEVWKVPPRNINFTGRELQLGRLRGGIGERITAVVPHALHGLGGVGKTQMAIEYAYRFRAEYDVVWWIPADQPGLVRSNLAMLAPRLGVPDPTSTGIEEAALAVLEALRRGEPYARWLLIFDNADEPEDLTDLLPPGPGDVLITSRNHRWGSVVEALAIDVFTREESVDFLKKRMRRSIGDADAGRLADALGDLPLALEQAAALQTETGMSAEEYLRLLKEQTASLLSEGKPTEYPVSMTAAWGLSVAKLKESLPEAVDLLRCCAFFGPEPIPRTAFRPVPGPVRPEVAEVLADPIRLSKVIKRLGRYALIRVETETGARTLQVHRLIQALLREELPVDVQDTIRSEVHSLMVGAAPQNPDDPADWPQYDALLAHVGPTRVAGSTRDDVRDFAMNILTYLSASGNHEAARTHVQTFLEQWTASSGPADLHVLRARRAQGNLLRDRGRYNEAYELNQETLKTMREAVGEKHRDTLMLLNGIGADLRARGLFHEARDHDAESVRLHEEVLGPEHVLTLRAINNLALDYGLTSEYQGARSLLEEALRTAQFAQPVVTRGTVLNLWTGLGRIVRLCGDFEEACDMGEEALAYGFEAFSADHPRILMAQKDLSIARLRTGERDRALELASDVHARYKRLYDLDHPGTLAAATALSNAMRYNAQAEEAFTLAQDTMQRYPAMYGAEHPYNYGCASNVALLHRVLGRPRQARDLNRQNLAGIEAKLGRDHHYVLIIALNLASDLSELGELDEACALEEDTHRRLAALLGDTHPTTLGAAANLAADLATAGRKEEAQRLHDATMRHYTETLTMEHADAVAAAEGRHLDFDFDPPPV
ncbi:Tetratricopeptide repeat-containing protein [Nonomuraea solani]|uniref:Tetratricopeptide repeat-containing protein n=1 Tax=Nonomuraea solani TaxID=1144553 RepID=A0A1H6EW08_9ACTN|nr:FxSxx-COOH system tetratricopeptide repeat protein [Nonomuraea solani]SEH01226.1 Tetratricopeptide repeat-containing protein [Nonomuraea solani]